jgi:hypothetical protein
MQLLRTDTVQFHKKTIVLKILQQTVFLYLDKTKDDQRGLYTRNITLFATHPCFSLFCIIKQRKTGGGGANN